jgi:hypothetical protein
MKIFAGLGDHDGNIIIPALPVFSLIDNLQAMEKVEVIN